MFIIMNVSQDTNLSLPKLTSERLTLMLLQPSEAELPRKYFLKNREHLSSSMPRLDEEFFELSYWTKKLETNIQEYQVSNSIRFFILPKENNKVIGTCNFTEFIGGVYQGCFLGYGIDKDYQGQGLMTEALRIAIDFTFEKTNIHKINANYMPSNLGSEKVLAKLGFRKIGVAEKELYLSGEWRDHIETRKINPNWKNNFDT